MNIKFYLSILKGNKWVIFTTVAVTVIAVIIGTQMITPVYSASTTLRVATASASTGSYIDITYSDRLMNTYTKIATSRPVLEELANKLNLEIIPDVKVSTISLTELIQINVKSPDPMIAQNAANTLADILITQSQELYSGGEKSTTEILGEQLAIAETELNQVRTDYETLVAKSPDDSDGIAKAKLVTDLKQNTYETLLDQYEAARIREALRANTITIVEPANLPLKPSQPNLVMNITLGFIVGLVGGIGLAFLFENLNPRLYSMAQVEAVTELDVIGKIPSIKRKGVTGLFTHTLNINSALFKESFHKLQTKISQQNTDGHTMKSLLVTSAVPGEGKSTVVTNLAFAMAETGQKVLVIDCDMRLPALNKFFGLPNTLGLSTLLNQETTLTNVLQKTRIPNVQVITSGPVPPNPMGLLGLPLMKALIEKLGQHYDCILLDTPAILPVGDAIVLATIVDAIALVTRQTFSKEDAVRDACKQLVDLNRRTLGVIVNDAAMNGNSYYYHRKYS
jgi:non-specific protein-tyrosine kinase